MRVRDIIFGVLDTGVKIALVLAAVIIIYRGSNLAFDYGYRIFDEKPMSEVGRDVVVEIPEVQVAEYQLPLPLGISRLDEAVAAPHKVADDVQPV